MKQLTQAVFKDAPDWAASAAVDDDGTAYWYNAQSSQLVINYEWGHHYVNAYVEDLPNYPEHSDEFEIAGFGYDTSDWQNSAIDREFAA